MIYTWSAVVAVVVAVVVDLWVLRTQMLTTRVFWLAYAIILTFQFLINGLLTSIPVVTYSPEVILGTRLFFAPVEDVGYGFGLVVLTVSAWTWAGRRERAATDREPAGRS